MIYRFHVFEKDNDNRVRTAHSNVALNSVLTGLPEQLNWILDLDKQEAYLKITTNLEKNTVVSAIHNKLSLNGLVGTLIS